jgi:hypothetical protein
LLHWRGARGGEPRQQDERHCCHSSTEADDCTEWNAHVVSPWIARAMDKRLFGGETVEPEFGGAKAGDIK